MRMIASVVGATGLVGAEVVSLLCSDADVDEVHVLVRRTLDNPRLARNPKLIQHVVDFERLNQVSWPNADALFCCLGTTIKAAGSRSAFRTVDFDYVVGSARLARRAGASSLVVVSAVGADAKSSVFYSRTKGEMEAAVETLGFDSVVLIRPSLLEGARTESRFGERIALVASKLIRPLLPARYRPVTSQAVAHAMIASAKKRTRGVTVIESEQIAEF